MSAHYVMGEGWTAILSTRYEGEAWGEAPGTVYSHLTTDELYDVLVSELATQLYLDAQPIPDGDQELR